MTKPRFFIVGLPKSGTSTIDQAFSSAGLQPVHWLHNGMPIGKLMYDGWFDFDDPLHFFEGVDAITQMDFCSAEPGIPKDSEQKLDLLNYWPNLDLGLIVRIKQMYPESKFILNYRSPAETSDSMERWHGLSERMASQSITGLPIGRGNRPSELMKFIENHHGALRHLFRDDPNFLELDITSESAGEQFQEFLGVEVPWWGVANKNEKTTARSHAT
ncbi:MAG: sulfotransferase family protein [Pseudomonadota bacterium]